ncbi:MAG: DUF721 domain-containing protein [candidate division Zixibacteria bacterium]|nr:DUF721 domain-containing protein [candidate division Zixibacteria bacterium]
MNYRNRPSKGRAQPKPLGGIIDNVVRSLGISRSYNGWLVVSQWPEIVGEGIAEKAKAVRYEEGTIYVAVPDASWRHNLSMETEQILRKIHTLPYGKGVRQLRLVSGEKGI